MARRASIVPMRRYYADNIRIQTFTFDVSDARHWQKLFPGQRVFLFDHDPDGVARFAQSDTGSGRVALGVRVAVLNAARLAIGTGPMNVSGCCARTPGLSTVLTHCRALANLALDPESVQTNPIVQFPDGPALFLHWFPGVQQTAIHHRCSSTIRRRFVCRRYRPCPHKDCYPHLGRHRPCLDPSALHRRCRPWMSQSLPRTL